MNAVQQYIEQSAPFARPILLHIRSLVLTACPEVEEHIKWNMPFFMFKGEPLCSMAAFKHHCAVHIHKASIMNDPWLTDRLIGKTAMGNFGKITHLHDLPSDEQIIGYIHKAMSLAGIKIPRSSKPKQSLAMPSALHQFLSENPTIQQRFSKLAHAHQQEHIRAIADAKKPDTILRRLDKLREKLMS
jgi:uncharacterized protein YdeI (YjbR/CyaY-like superfamily)